MHRGKVGGRDSIDARDSFAPDPLRSGGVTLDELPGDDDSLELVGALAGREQGGVPVVARDARPALGHVDAAELESGQDLLQPAALALAGIRKGSMGRRWGYAASSA